jgi:hypothetical protein
MFETADELASLQRLLEDSLAGSTGHLRSIITPERTLDAERLCAALPGMQTLSLATVTASGEPRISAVDGHFLHGRWVFGTARAAAKARHLAARPAASVSHLRGEELGVFTHGRVEVLNPEGGPDDPEWPAILRHLTDHYGQSPYTFGEIVYYRLVPTWMTVFHGATEVDEDGKPEAPAAD